MFSDTKHFPNYSNTVLPHGKKTVPSNYKNSIRFPPTGQFLSRAMLQDRARGLNHHQKDNEVQGALHV